MRRIAALLLALSFLSLPGCQTASRAIRDSIFGGLAEKYDTSRAPDARRAAYDRYVDEYVDR